MIRYVLAALLTVALVGVSMGVISYGAGVSSERQVSSDVIQLDRAAQSILADEDLPPNAENGPQRVVTIRFPADSPTATPLDTFEVQRVNESLTTVTYRIDGRTTRTHVIDAPIVSADQHERERLMLSGTDEAMRLLLTLERDETGDRVVKLSQID